MHKLFFLICFLACFSASAQRTLSSGNAIIKFVSTRNSDVSAVNNRVNVTIDETGNISFNLLIRGFKFAMAEMEEHFNKEYMESDKYPDAWFRGRLLKPGKIDLGKPGLYKVQANGELFIHNVIRKIVVNGTVRIQQNKVDLSAKFTININDYNIDTGLGGIIIGNKMNIDVSAIL